MPVDAALARRNALVEALHRTALGLLDRLDPTTLLGDIARQAVALADAPEGYVYLVEDDALVVRVAVGPHVGKYMGLRLAKGEGIAGRAWASGAPLVVPDYAVWQGRSAKIHRDDVRAVAAFPLFSRGEVTGVLGIFHNEEGQAFDDERLWLLGQYAQLASVALDHARLVSELKAAQEALREQAITRTLVRSMLQDIGRAGPIPPHVMRDMGRGLAAQVQGKAMSDYLSAFAAMGLGELRVHAHHQGRFTLHGKDLLELAPGATQPSCKLPLGFAEGAYKALTGEDALGTELRCQSLGHEACVFVVMGRAVRR